MAARDTLISIINVLRTLQEVNLLYYYQDPIMIQNGDIEMVSWPNHHAGAVYNADSAYATFLQYQRILEDNSFLGILCDGAIIRGNYAFRRNELIKHSLWYWPCPFDIPPDDIIEETPLGALELYCASWKDRVRFRTPLRFDYDPDREKPDHPASHLHIQTSQCRIAVVRPLGFATFVRFVFRHFLPESWRCTSVWSDLSDEIEDESQYCLSASDIFTPHINWNRLVQ